jgi:hypothetical protein
MEHGCARNVLLDKCIARKILMNCIGEVTQLHGIAISRENMFRPNCASAHKGAFRNRSALPITETELKLIAALAIIGLSNKPQIG